MAGYLVPTSELVEKSRVGNAGRAVRAAGGRLVQTRRVNRSLDQLQYYGAQKPNAIGQRIARTERNQRLARRSGAVAGAVGSTAGVYELGRRSGRREGMSKAAAWREGAVHAELDGLMEVLKASRDRRSPEEIEHAERWQRHPEEERAYYRGAKPSYLAGGALGAAGAGLSLKGVTYTDRYLHTPSGTRMWLGRTTKLNRRGKAGILAGAAGFGALVHGDVKGHKKANEWRQSHNRRPRSGWTGNFRDPR